MRTVNYDLEELAEIFLDLGIDDQKAMDEARFRVYGVMAPWIVDRECERLRNIQEQRRRFEVLATRLREEEDVDAS